MYHYVFRTTKYLSKLRGNTGNALMFHRIGSISSSVVDNPVDYYEVVCMDDTQWNQLYFDCYHLRRSNFCPPGYTLMPFNKSLGMDIPYGLPDAIINLYGERPMAAFARRVKESLQKYSFKCN